MAANQAADRQPTTSSRAVDFDRFGGIARTRRVEATRRDAARHQMLIGLDQSDEHPGHDGTSSVTRRMARFICSLNSSKEACSAPGTAPIRYTPGGKEPARSSSVRMARSRRRNRLRTTAVPTRRPMANPTSVGSVSGWGRYLTHNGPLPTRRPRRRRESNPERPRMDRIRPKAVPGPYGGGPAERHDRRGRPCGDGNRGAWPASVHSVDRYASRQVASSACGYSHNETRSARVLSRPGDGRAGSDRSAPPEPKHAVANADRPRLERG